MRGRPQSTDPRAGSTRVVEVIGVAGAGKTTLYQALACRPDLFHPDNFPHVRKASDAPFFVWNGVRLIPHLLRMPRSDSRQLTRREFAWMTILYGWSALLYKKSSEGGRVFVLDQGPIYLMAEMQLFGPEYLRRTSAGKLWQHLYDHWGPVLDVVIWLDAPNDVLLERIRSREQEHIVKTQPASVVYEFLDRYRCAYEFILSKMMARKPELSILRFNTGQQTSQMMVNRVCSEIRS